MNQNTLRRENDDFQGTPGVSENNRHARFQPAFQDLSTGHVEVSRLKTGEPAAVHIISFLPMDWAEIMDGDGHILALKPDVVSGFVRDGVFYTREELAGV